MAFPGVSKTYANLTRWVQDATTVINNTLQGKTNNVALWTLDANQSSTTFTDTRIGFESHFGFQPTTANAAAEIGGGTLYVSETGRKNNEVTVVHANAVSTDRTFRVSIIG